MDLNRVILIGRMASDPELKYTPSGIPVSQFRLAVNRPMSAEARQSGQEKQADFFSIVAWRQSAEYAANYLGKGRLVAIEGRLQVREYSTQDGQKRRDTEIVVDNLKSLDRPKEDNGGGYDNGSYPRSNGSSRPSSPADEYQEEAPAAAPAAAPAPRPAAAPAAPASAAPARRPASAAPSRPPAPVYEDDLDDPFADN
jgi:single-strand DNA-binding protein